MHDAVRPLVDHELLTQLIDEAMQHGAAGPVCKLTSTVVKVTEDGFLEQALERRTYRASEMPQAFRASLLKQAYDVVS